LGWGQTPVTIRNVSFGTQTIRVTSDGYVSEQRTVRLTGDQPLTSVNVTMRAAARP
jgi:hypothetical protein